MEQFIGSHPELAFDAITSSLQCLRTYSSDQTAVKLGMVLLVVGALPDAAVYEECVPLVLPGSVSESFRNYLRGMFDAVMQPGGEHRVLVDFDDYTRDEGLLLRKYQSVLMDSQGVMSEQELSAVQATVTDWLVCDKQQLLTEVIVPSVLSAARRHAARSTDARA